VRALPPGLGHGAAAAGGGLWFRFNAVQREYALDNYAAVLALDRSDPRVRRVARAAFQNYGRMLADFVLLGSLSAHQLLRRVRFEGLEHVDAGLATGRGVVVAMPHMGSWDVAGSAAGVRGYEVTTLADRFPGSLDEAVVASRRRFGLEVLPPDRASLHLLREGLRSNRVVALVCDLPHGPGVEVEMFGRRLNMPSGPAALAQRHGCDLITAAIVREGNGYAVRVDPRLEVAGLTRQGIMQSVARRFEVHIRAQPDQWFAFMPVFG